MDDILECWHNSKLLNSYEMELLNKCRDEYTYNNRLANNIYFTNMIL